MLFNSAAKQVKQYIHEKKSVLVVDHRGCSKDWRFGGRSMGALVYAGLSFVTVAIGLCVLPVSPPL